MSEKASFGLEATLINNKTKKQKQNSYFWAETHSSYMHIPFKPLEILKYSVHYQHMKNGATLYVVTKEIIFLNFSAVFLQVPEQTFRARQTEK